MPAVEALVVLQDVRRMMTDGRTHQSSYEGQILDKLDKAIAELEGTELVDVRFSVHRDDLVEALSRYPHSPTKIDGVETSVLLSFLLQISLYDDGPQLEGSYEIMDKV